jgi:anti-sigma-K factor RskA
MTPDDDLAAAEYVLGTLAPAERATIAARRLREADLDAAIRAWEERLAPLTDIGEPVEPPADLLPAIEARVRGVVSGVGNAGAVSDSVVQALRRSVARWRLGAIAASLAAAILAVGFAAREATRERPAREYVAILQKDADSPAIEVTVDLDRKEFTVRPVAATPPPGKSYELWIIDPRLGPPRSLGVIGDQTRSASLAGLDRAAVQSATYAVTVEPPGGSPEGKPSGTPVFVGKLIPVGP